MGFRINTNIAALNAHNNGVMNNRALDSSLAKLSSGLRINSAADDASGMAIADSLRSQASALGQAIRNANDAQSIIQIADKAMDEQIKILDTIKTKAIQAAQDGQSRDSRVALQADITRLMESLDNIASTTSYNGQNLLAGSFSNKEFQVGAYSNQTVKASIGATDSNHIGSVSFATGIAIPAETSSALTFSTASGDLTLQAIPISTSAGTGLGELTKVINNATELTGVRASYDVSITYSNALVASSVDGMTINGISIGSFSVVPGDQNGNMVNAINAKTSETGVQAAVDVQGRLTLTSLDGRGISVAATTWATGLEDLTSMGQLTLSRLDASAIIVDPGTAADFGLAAGATLKLTTLNLADVKSNIGSTDAVAIGAIGYSGARTNVSGGIGAGVTSFAGAQAAIDIAESAQKQLDRVRADLGSVQNQIVTVVNNISVTQVNVAAAESQIRDVDFAAESATFSKHNILAQSGSFAMSQANAVQQNVLSLLQ